MELFLGADGYVSLEFTEDFNQIADEIKGEFNQCIGNLFQTYNDIVWWSSAPVSRNTFCSDLFYAFCAVALFQKLKDEKRITSVKTQSKPIFQILKASSSPIPMHYQPLEVSGSLKSFIRPFYRLCMVFGRLVLNWGITRLLPKNHPLEKISLIDTYLLPTDALEKRYYPQIVEFHKLSPVPLKIVPTLTGNSIWDYIKYYQLLKKRTDYLYKEHFLKLSDYLYILKSVFKFFFYQVPPVPFKSYDLSLFVSFELKTLVGVDQTILSLVNYRFARRLKQSNIELHYVLDWFENQSVDKGWNYGFNQFFPKVSNAGYLGFIQSNQFLCMFPSDYELRARVLPQKIFVGGKGFISHLQKFSNQVFFDTVPAFRFQHVWNSRKNYPDSSQKTIIVGMPITLAEGVKMLKTVLQGVSMLEQNSLQILVKLHPTNSLEQLKSYLDSGQLKQFEIVEGDFSDCVERSNLLISMASSLCLETLAKGIPVLILGSPGRLIQNPVPESVPKLMWKICSSPEEVARNILHFLHTIENDTKRIEQTAMRIRHEYFEPLTEEGIIKFIYGAC